MKPLFPYIWEHSRREQVVILIIVAVSFPFYFVSLDLPKYIVSDAIQGRAFAGGKAEAILFHLQMSLPTFLGGRTYEFHPGISFERFPYLFVLSAVFLVLVLINGWFKYVINMRKGALGERLLQQLRFDLFAMLLRFTPEALRNVKASEAATIIKDEVEPIGGFVGDAFIQPVFLGGQALTALVFIILQSPILGTLAGLIVFAQAAVIPRLRREQIRLGKERQIQSRALAGRIGEVVDGLGEVSNHGTGNYERLRIATMLERLFSIRFQLFGRKFAVKFLNNLLAQLTPFLFYTLGGVAALRGDIDIGQLVAVIAAYRDLPPPVKELIDWDQQRLDVDVKYQQVVEQFSVGATLADPAPIEPEPTLGAGAIQVQGLRVSSASGDILLDGVNATLPLGAHTALVERSGDGARTLGQVLGRRITAYAGTVRLSGLELDQWPQDRLGGLVAYAGAEAIIFDGSIRDNILYSLNRKAAPVGASPLALDASTDGDPIDYAAAGATGAQDIDARIIATLHLTGLEETVFRFGLARRIDPAQNPDFVTHVVELRRRLRLELADREMSALVEPFDPVRYNLNATVGENLLFGVPLDDSLTEAALIKEPFTREVLKGADLVDPLAVMGRRIAATMVEIFTGLSPDHFLFEQFSFISADQLDPYREILSQTEGPASGYSAGNKERLIALALLYVEPRHRLNLLTEDLKRKVLAGRAAFRRDAPEHIVRGLEFYDPESFCTAAPLRDNLLFGRITYGASGAADKVYTVMRRLISEMGLERDVYRIGLEQPCGHAGRLLFPAQRFALALARCLVKRPEILILNDAVLSPGDPDAAILLARIREAMAGKTLIMLVRAGDPVNDFDVRLSFAHGKLETADQVTEMPETREAAAPETIMPENEEVRTLRAVPMFADVDLARLKLLAFTSERLTFKAGDTVFRQGDASDTAYVVISGAADVLLDTANGPIKVSSVGPSAIIGEIGIITGAPRSATIVAVSELSTLCIRQEIFLSLMAEFPEMSLAVTRLMVRRLQDNVATLSSARP